MDLENLVKKACGKTFEDAISSYPLLSKERVTFVCMDITYQYALLVDGFGRFPLYMIMFKFIQIGYCYYYVFVFHCLCMYLFPGLDPNQKFTLADKIEYEDALVETAWALGTAIEAISSLPKFERLMYFM